MQKGDRKVVSICPSCRRVAEFTGFTTKRFEFGLVEFGLQCPKCDHWQHSYWMDDELLMMQTLQPTRKVKRDYEHKFDKLQKRMEKREKLGTLPEEINHVLSS